MCVFVCVFVCWRGKAKAILALYSCVYYFRNRRGQFSKHAVLGLLRVWGTGVFFYWELVCQGPGVTNHFLHVAAHSLFFVVFLMDPLLSVCCIQLSSKISHPSDARRERDSEKSYQRGGDGMKARSGSPTSFRGYAAVFCNLKN